MLLDKELPWKTFFQSNGADFLPIFFKLTYYGSDIQFSVANKTLEKNCELEVCEDHDSLCWLLTNIKKIDSQINYVLNNLILKVITA